MLEDAEPGLDARHCPSDVQAVLATDKVRFQGQEVAFVVAEDRYSARDALELIDVEYEPLPAVIDATQGAGPGRPGDPRRPGRAGTTTTSSTGRPGTSAATDAVFAERRRGRGRGHALPAVAPGADGDLRLGRRHGQGHREADDLDHHPGAARPPHHLRAGGRGARAQDPGSYRPTSAAGSATRSGSTPATCARSSAPSSPASR